MLRLVRIFVQSAILWFCLRGFVLPVSGWAKNNALLLSVVFDGRLIDVAAAKDTRLEVLVLSVLAIEVLSLDLRLSILDWLLLIVSPIDTLSHQVSVASIILKTVLIGCLPIQLLHYLLVGWNCLPLNLRGLRLRDHRVIRAFFIGNLIIAEKVCGSWTVAAELGPCRLHQDGCTENRRVECILVTHSDLLRRHNVGISGLECVCNAFFDNFLRFRSGFLHYCIQFICAENVRILVGGSHNRLFQWILSKNDWMAWFMLEWRLGKSWRFECVGDSLSGALLSRWFTFWISLKDIRFFIGFLSRFRTLFGC